MLALTLRWLIITYRTISRSRFQYHPLVVQQIASAVNSRRPSSLKRNPPGIGDTGIGATRVEQLFKRVFLVDRHDAVAGVVINGVQGNGEIDVKLFPAFSHGRDNTGRRERDPAF